MYITIPEARAVKFWSRVHRTDRCWDWMGSTDNEGYGSFQIEKKRFAANRVAWVLEVEDLCSLNLLKRTCKNHSCVRPAHMKLIPRAVKAADQLSSRYHILAYPRKTVKPKKTERVSTEKRKSYIDRVLRHEANANGGDDTAVYLAEVKEIRRVLHITTEALYQMKAYVFALGKDARAFMDRLESTATQRLDALIQDNVGFLADVGAIRQELFRHTEQLELLQDTATVAPAVVHGEAIDAASDPADTTAPSTIEQGVPPSNLAGSLLRLVARVVDVPVEYNDTSSAAIMTVFDLAVTQCHGNNQLAVELFGRWAEHYNQHLLRSPAAERSILAFAEMATRPETIVSEARSSPDPSCTEDARFATENSPRVTRQSPDRDTDC